MAGGLEGDWVRVGTSEEVREAGITVVTAARARIAVFADRASEELSAVDNRCPHMGFPLERGTVRDGILTCHWHQARFDLRSGCTFDLWADDVPRYEVRTDEDDIVWVSPTPLRPLDQEYHLRRLRRGLAQDVALVLAKSLLALLEGGGDIKAIAGEVARFAGANLRSWTTGLESLACVANLYPFLSRETAYQALLYASRQIATEAASSVPRRGREPLGDEAHPVDTLDTWLRSWTQNRHRDAAERTVLTALQQNPTAAELSQILFSSVAERLYANTGHLFDFMNKCFELVELLGPEEGPALFPVLMTELTQVRGEEENTDWHHPIEIVEPIRALEAELPELLARGASETWKEDPALVDVLLGDDPLVILEALRQALIEGAAPPELAKRIAYAAALRLARFATSNEVTDWITAQHVMNFTNAVHQVVSRTRAPGVVRAIFPAAIAVYQVRFLNVPPARLPGERGRGSELPDGAADLRKALLEALDQRGNVEPAARLVSHYVRQGHPFDALVDTLTLATVREDLDFHTLQVLEAGVRQAQAWGARPEAEHVLVGVIRSLAAQCPTRRAGQQTSRIALRLHRGDNVFEEA